MAIFPKIDSPCPYKNQLASIMDGDYCRMCKRNVVDITEMSDGERVAFLKGCKDEVCVSYRLPIRPVLAAAVVIAAAVTPVAAAACEATEVVTITMGGIKDPANAKYVQHPADSNVPVLPIVYEKSSAVHDTTRTGSETPSSPARVSSEAAS
jgi:predicted Fe-S protein YdhL (DUF1289 family)